MTKRSLTVVASVAVIMTIGRIQNADCTLTTWARGSLIPKLEQPFNAVNSERAVVGTPVTANQFPYNVTMNETNNSKTGTGQSKGEADTDGNEQIKKTKGGKPHSVDHQILKKIKEFIAKYDTQAVIIKHGAQDAETNNKLITIIKNILSKQHKRHDDLQTEVKTLKSKVEDFSIGSEFLTIQQNKVQAKIDKMTATDQIKRREGTEGREQIKKTKGEKSDLTEAQILEELNKLDAKFDQQAIIIKGAVINAAKNKELLTCIIKDLKEQDKS